MAAILAPVAVPAAAAAAVDSTPAAGGAVAGGAAGVEGAAGVQEVCSGRKNEVIGRACTAAVEAVVEGAEVLAAAFRSPSTFVLLEVSIRGVSPHSEGVRIVCDRVIPRQKLYHPCDWRRAPVNVCGVTSGGVLSYATRVIIRLLV